MVDAVDPPQPLAQHHHRPHPAQECPVGRRQNGSDQDYPVHPLVGEEPQRFQLPLGIVVAVRQQDLKPLFFQHRLDPRQDGADGKGVDLGQHHPDDPGFAGAQALGLDHGPVARLRDHLGDGLLFLLGEVAVVQVAGHRRFGHTGQFCDF